MEDSTKVPGAQVSSDESLGVSRWISASSTHVGNVRKVNEDAFFEHPEIGLWAVADGVGGASAGDRASALIVEALGSVRKPDTAATLLTDVRDRLHAVNETLYREAPYMPRGLIASTVVILMFFQRHYACAWAGDSRLYLLRERHLRQVSRDHSQVQELVDQGVLSPELARHDSRGNVITRAVGADEKLELDVVHEHYLPNDVFLLCSDGLTKALGDDEIIALLDLPTTSAAEALIAASLDHGAPDNVTAVVVRILT
jgi:serine/threonine protein phosphatase PrpC